MSDDLLSDELADIRDRLAGIERILLKMADPAPDPLEEIPNIEPPEANTGNTWQDFIKSLMPLLLKLLEHDKPTVKITPPPFAYNEVMDKIKEIKEELASQRFDINSMRNTLDEHRTHLIAIDRDVEDIDKARPGADVKELRAHIDKQVELIDQIRKNINGNHQAQIGNLFERVKTLELAAKKSERIQ